MWHFKMFRGRRDISIIWETGHSLLWEMGHYILWETENSILWESDHLSSGILDNLWEPEHGKPETLSSGIRTTYPLGKRYLGCEVQPIVRVYCTMYIFAFIIRTFSNAFFKSKHLKVNKFAVVYFRSVCYFYFLDVP